MNQMPDQVLGPRRHDPKSSRIILGLLKNIVSFRNELISDKEPFFVEIFKNKKKPDAIVQKEKKINKNRSLVG